MLSYWARNPEGGEGGEGDGGGNMVGGGEERGRREDGGSEGERERGKEGGRARGRVREETGVEWDGGGLGRDREQLGRLEGRGEGVRQPGRGRYLSPIHSWPSFLYITSIYELMVYVPGIKQLLYMRDRSITQLAFDDEFPTNYSISQLYVFYFLGFVSGMCPPRRFLWFCAPQVLQLGIRACPDHGPLYRSWAQLEFQAGNTADSRRVFEKGIAACPTYSRLYYAYGDMEASMVSAIQYPRRVPR